MILRDAEQWAPGCTAPRAVLTQLVITPLAKVGTRLMGSRQPIQYTLAIAQRYDSGFKLPGDQADLNQQPSACLPSDVCNVLQTCLAAHLLLKLMNYRQ